jgi:hypothetical protein
MKTALKRKNDEFLVMPLKHVLSVMDLVNHSRTPKLWAIVHENGPKMQKRGVFGHASQKCIDCTGPHPRSPKLWAIAHENDHKRKNDEFLVMPLKHVLSVMGLVNHPGAPKLWAIAHKK